MKKIIRILGTMLLFALIMTGCSTQNSAPKTSDSKGDLVIRGNNFTGTVNTDNNGRQKMSVHFDRNNQAVVTMVGLSKTDGRWTKQIISGNYVFTEDKKRLEVTVNKAMNEGFDSKNDLQTDEVPTKMVESPVKGENFEFKIQKKNLVFSKNDKISPSKTAEVSDFAEYVGHDQKRYDKKYAKLSGRSFMSPATDLMENGIAFKGDKFIWKYGGSSEYSNGLDQGGSLVIYTGSYKLKGHELTLFRYKSTPLYEGTILNLSKNNYQNMIAATYLPAELTFKFTKNNQLHAITNNKYLNITDMLDYGTVSGTPNYAKWLKKYDIDRFEAKMQQKDISSADSDSDSTKNSESSDRNDDSKSNSTDYTDVKYVYPNASDFYDWVNDKMVNEYGESSDDDAVEHAFGDPGEDLDWTARDNGKAHDIHFVYTVNIADTYAGHEDEAPARMIGISDEGKVYMGTATPDFDDQWTQDYHDKADSLMWR